MLKNQSSSFTGRVTILFPRFWMWLLMRFFAYLRYSYSMEHQLSQSYLTKLVGNRIWLQIEAEIQFADSTDSMQVWVLVDSSSSGCTSNSITFLLCANTSSSTWNTRIRSFNHSNISRQDRPLLPRYSVKNKFAMESKYYTILK